MATHTTASSSAKTTLSLPPDTTLATRARLRQHTAEASTSPIISNTLPPLFAIKTTPYTSVLPSPVLTASSESGSPLSAAKIAGPDSTMTTQSTGGLSRSAQQAVIATTTIGGSLLLAFLFYALWRKRQGATYTEIVQFRHSSTITMSSRDPEITALPIYRESRFSVHSSKRGSGLSFSKFMHRSKLLSPSSESFSKAPWFWNPCKESPPSPTRVAHPLSQVTAQSPSSPPLKAPEFTHTPMSSHSERIRIDRTLSDGNFSKTLPKISIAESTPPRESDLVSPVQSPASDTDLHGDVRWSWTNSQAPPTPRLRPQSHARRSASYKSSKSSLSSLPRLRKVHDWVRQQNERATRSIAEERSPPARPKLPPLKNKASKPILAPLPARPTKRLSKKSGPPARSKSCPSTATVLESSEILPDKAAG